MFEETNELDGKYHAEMNSQVISIENGHFRLKNRSIVPFELRSGTKKTGKFVFWTKHQIIVSLLMHANMLLVILEWVV